MINMYGLKNLTSMEYYRVYQEVQSIKAASRAELATQLSIHEREKKHISTNENVSMMTGPKNVGSVFDVTV